MYLLIFLPDVKHCKGCTKFEINGPEYVPNYCWLFNEKVIGGKRCKQCIDAEVKAENYLEHRNQLFIIKEGE